MRFHRSHQGGALRGEIVVEYLSFAGIISNNFTIVKRWWNGRHFFTSQKSIRWVACNQDHTFFNVLSINSCFFFELLLFYLTSHPGRIFMVTCDNFVRAKIRKSIFNTVGEKLHLIIWIPILNTPFPIDKRKATFNPKGTGLFFDFQACGGQIQ